VARALRRAPLTARAQVLLKRLLGDTNAQTITVLLAGIGVANMLLGWAVVLALALTGAEPLPWAQAPWGYLCGSAALSLVFNLLVNLGVAYTSPIFIAVGTLIGVPLNALADIVRAPAPWGRSLTRVCWQVFRGRILSAWQYVGGALIIGCFVLVLLPDRLSIPLRCGHADGAPTAKEEAEPSGA
jgi:solute carrier family 35 protein F3/4